MAMNATNLGNEIKAALLAALAADYSDLADDERLTGYTFSEYLTKFSGAIASAIVTHITTNAKATGTDSPGGDSHNLSIS